MKYLTTIASGMILISSYLFTAEYPQYNKLSPKPIPRNNHTHIDRKPVFIMFYNELDHYDITIENSVVISPRQSERICLQLEENPAVRVFVDAIGSELTLELEDIPQKISFAEKSNHFEILYNDQCLAKYRYKAKK